MGRRGWTWESCFSFSAYTSPAGLWDRRDELEAGSKRAAWPWRKRCWGRGAFSHLQCLHMLIHPGGLFLQAGDRVFGADQSTVDPTLGKDRRQGGHGCVGANPNPKENSRPEWGLASHLGWHFGPGPHLSDPCAIKPGVDVFSAWQMGRKISWTRREWGMGGALRHGGGWGVDREIGSTKH